MGGETFASAQGPLEGQETGLLENRVGGGSERPARWSVLVGG